MICDPHPSKHPQPQHAVGYDFEPLPNKDFLLELYNNDGYTFAEAVLTRDQLESLPNVVNIVLKYVDEHGYPAYSFSDLPNRHQDEIARTRREAMDEAEREEI